MHPVQKDVRSGVRIRNLDHTRSCLILLGDVRLEGGPTLCARDDALEAREKLASITDSQGESVLAFEEGSEFFTDFGIKQDGGCPASAST